MNSKARSDNETSDTATRRRECAQTLKRDPAVWAWMVVAALALLPLGTALAGL